jgi:hypothetical protein
MKSWSFLLLIVLTGDIGSQKVMASPPIEVTSKMGSEGNFNDVLKLLWSTLKYSEKVGHLYYTGACSQDDSDTLQFPKVNVRRPTKGSAGFTAVKQIFEDDSNVLLTEGHDDVVEVRIGDVSDKLLKTKISVVRLRPIDQYNYTSAIVALRNSPEVMQAAEVLHIHTVPVVVNEIIVQPSEGLLHLPAVMANLTLGQALDEVAKTFRGVVSYGACEQHGLYKIDFFGGPYLDDASLNNIGVQ